MTAPSSSRRYDQLLREWVLVSEGRLDRPWSGEASRQDDVAAPTYDPECPLCPGNERASGIRNPQYTAGFVFENDFPAVAAAGEAPHSSNGLFVAEAQRGCCEVLVYSPDHSRRPARLGVAGHRHVVELWCEHVLRLSQRFRWVQVFENQGTMMGASNPHPHGQIWSTEQVPTIPVREDQAQLAYFERNGSALLVDYAEAEVCRGERLIAANASWVAVVPWWARWPFEALLVPRRRVGSLPDLEPAERDDLAAVIDELLQRFDGVFDAPFPYSMGWHPALDPAARHAVLHAHYYPPLLRSATVRKHMVGYELLAEPQRDLSPEAAAARLRNDSGRAHSRIPIVSAPKNP